MLDYAGSSKSVRESEMKLPRTRCFGDYEVDLIAGEVRKRGVKLALSGQPFEVLRLLLEKAGEVVTREELRARLWTVETFVDFDHGLNAAVNKLREVLGDSAHQPRYLETLPRRGYRFVAPVRSNSVRPISSRSSLGVKQIRSVAVLPLDNLSGDPEQEYFADGMTEVLINDLAKIDALRVISRNSVMRYKGVRKPLAEIAEELNVDGIVEGTVLRIESRVRITAELIHAPSDTHVWAERYEGDLSDVLRLQGEVAQAIASEIRVKVRPQERARLSRAPVLSGEANEAYLKGRYYWNKRTPSGLERSLVHFERAIEKSPTYALAHAGIAEAYAIAGSLLLEVISPREAMPMARAAARKALQIDETLGEAHATLAYISAVYDYDWEAAEKGFRHALLLNPGDATARQFYALHWAYRGKPSEAATEIERARQLDPLSLQINTEIANIFYLARFYDRAIEQALTTLDLDPTFHGAHFILSLAYKQKEMLAAALEEAEKAVALSGRSTASLGCLGGCLAAIARINDAEEIIGELQNLSRRQFVPSFVFAWISANLRDTESTLTYLEQSYAERASYLAVIKAEPTFDFLRSDERFQDLQRRVGLSA